MDMRKVVKNDDGTIYEIVPVRGGNDTASSKPHRWRLVGKQHDVIAVGEPRATQAAATRDAHRDRDLRFGSS
jgi:hypothetical protein